MQKFLFARVEMWVVLLLAILAIAAALLFGAAVLEAERKTTTLPKLASVALQLADVPRTVQQLLTNEPMVAFNSGRFPGARGWSFPQGADAARRDGYVLLSRYDGDARRHMIELWALADWTRVWIWQPDSATLMEGIPQSRWVLAQSSAWNPATWRAIAPWPFENGDLLVRDHQAPLLRIDACGRLVWRNEETLFHHSIESDGAGGFWTPSVIEPQSIRGVAADFRDDGLGHVDAQGRLISNESLVQILIDNGYEPQMFGVGRYSDDLVHLNDIQPVLADGPHWRKGDLFLSARRLSTVFLYRPSERRIVWARTGPWMSQHDVDILDDHRIAVFDNRAYDGGYMGKVRGHSDVAVYDFATDKVSYPYAEAMRDADMKTLSEGLQEVLPGGGLLVEEENAGRVLLLDRDKSLVAQFVNRAADGKVYRLGWTRFVDAATGDRLVANLRKTACTP
jgi:hypothetical protein